MKRHFWWIATVAASAALAGCFGNDDETPAPKATDQLSSDASKSSAGLVAYIAQLVRETNDGTADPKEPVDISSFAPQTPDDTDPELIPSDIS